MNSSSNITAARTSKKVPNNAGKKYFKWEMETRALLLIEAREKEVWDVPYSQNEKVWTDICTILKSYPNYEVTFQNLNWRRCEEEYCRSVAAYAADRRGVPFRSGKAEQHEQWHNIMEEIFELNST